VKRKEYDLDPSDAFWRANAGIIFPEVARMHSGGHVVSACVCVCVCRALRVCVCLGVVWCVAAMAGLIVMPRCCHVGAAVKVETELAKLKEEHDRVTRITSQLSADDLMGYAIKTHTHTHTLSLSYVGAYVGGLCQQSLGGAGDEGV
jgi:hypothetical protein